METKVAWPKVIWDADDPAVPYMVDFMLSDIGIVYVTVRAAARNYALKLLREVGSLTMGEWQHMVGLFALGYEAALKDNHLLCPGSFLCTFLNVGGAWG